MKIQSVFIEKMSALNGCVLVKAVANIVNEKDENVAIITSCGVMYDCDVDEKTKSEYCYIELTQLQAFIVKLSDNNKAGWIDTRLIVQEMQKYFK